MSLYSDAEVVGMEETEALTRCAFDTACKKVIEALLSDDDAQAGKVIRLELEYLLRDAAAAKTVGEDFTEEMREAARKQAIKDLLGDIALMEAAR